MIQSEVKVWHGVPTLFINGQPTIDPAYITYLPERNDYARFAEAGYHLYSITIYFGKQTINETSQIHPFAPGIFDVKGQADFSVPDREIQRIIEADSQAMIFPRVNTALPKWWEDEHPDELNDEGFKGNRRRASFASDLWFEAVDDGLRQLAEHVAASPYADHIFAYQIAGGNTEEWFAFDQKGGMSQRAREKWALRADKGSTEADFYAFLSEITADAISSLAHNMKEYTGHRLVIGSFFGYTLEAAYREAGHGAHMKLLACEDIDFLCSPMSYAQLRKPGIDHACMTTLESVLKHGKLYFTEVDERTHMTRLLADCREDSCEPGTYDHGVWVGPQDAVTARNVLRIDFARQMIHGNNFWWFDMWGHWYDEGILADFAEEKAILRRSMADEDRAMNAEAAVYIDEACHALNEKFQDGAAAYNVRIPLGSAGVPYACYDAADFEETYRGCKAFVLIETAATTKMEAIKARLDAEKRPYLLIKNDTVLSSGLFREFFRKHGLHVWCDSDDVLHANAHWVAIHAAQAGEKALHLPCVCRIEPQFEASEPFVGNEIRAELAQFETRLYRIDAI